MDQKISIVGAGNIATFYATSLYQKGISVQAIFSKNKNNAEVLALQIKAMATDNLNQLVQNADIIILAIPDNALIEYNKLPIFQHKIVIHTAGSIFLEELANISSQLGCIWPVYSIQKNNLPKVNIPLIINATDDNTLQVVKNIANAISNQSVLLKDELKLKLHLASVIANNFSNHLLTISKNICTLNHVSYDLLLPLIEQTFNTYTISHPDETQTGPAIRHDSHTLLKHENMLKENDVLKEIYTLMSKSIQTFNTQ